MVFCSWCTGFITSMGAVEQSTAAQLWKYQDTAATSA